MPFSTDAIRAICIALIDLDKEDVVADQTRPGIDLMSYQRPIQLTFIQSLWVIEVIRSGSVAKKFHASAHLSRMSS